MGETRVIGLVESAHVLSHLLVGLVDGDSLLNELERIEHKGDPVEQVAATSLVLDVLVELVLVALRDDVPGLGGARVAVVEGVEPEILDVPAEGGEHHAHVDPGRGDAANVLLAAVYDFKDGRGRLVDVVEVE